MTDYKRRLKNENERHLEEVEEIFEESGVDKIPDMLEEAHDLSNECEIMDREIFDLVHKVLFHMTPRKRTINITNDSGYAKHGITIRDEGVYRYNKTRRMDGYGFKENRDEIINCFEENEKRKLASEVLGKFQKFRSELKGKQTREDVLEVDDFLTPKVNIKVKSYGAKLRYKEDPSAKYGGWETIKFEEEIKSIPQISEEEFGIVYRNSEKIKKVLSNILEGLRGLHQEKTELVEYFEDKLSKYAVADLL